MTTFATCWACRREMSPGTSCTSLPNRIPWGSETGLVELLGDLWPQPCNDCGTAPGGLHHPGCDMEECALCHGQAIGCDCGTQ